jgi:phosphomannomutase
MSAVTPELAERVRAWIAADPDPVSQAELQSLLDAGEQGDDASEADLQDRFATPLVFGTAGLRGPLRAGPNGMNVAVVRRAAAGLAAYLLANRPGVPSVVIGYDARHGSEQFAVDSARVMAAAGLRATLLPARLPTPVLAYAVRACDADAGVMVTASHNPPQDNGYKVYLGGPPGDPASGAQIVPPEDAHIEAAIAAAPPASQLPLSEDYARLDDRVVEGYLDAITALTLTPERDVRIAYTPLHGVGRDVVLRAFAKAGFAAPEVVAAQAAPDPDFPTVAFPNPEEPGATDLLLELARTTSADIAIANDPDADRCAAAVGGRLLSGDELGLLLGDHLLRGAPGRLDTVRSRRPLVATSLVSSSALQALARARGADSATTMTGFKWLARAGGEELIFAYEEALGYAVGLRYVRDKDGISAALAVAELAAQLKTRGQTLLDRLDELAVELGLFATRQVSVRLSDPRAIERALELLLTATPPQLGSRRVLAASDLSQPRDGMPPTEGVRLTLAGGRIIVRPSGTEPKIKAYLELVTPPEEITDLPAARAAAALELTEIAADLRPLLG